MTADVWALFYTKRSLTMYCFTTCTIHEYSETACPIATRAHYTTMTRELGAACAHTRFQLIRSVNGADGLVPDTSLHDAVVGDRSVRAERNTKIAKTNTRDKRERNSRHGSVSTDWNKKARSALLNFSSREPRGSQIQLRKLGDSCPGQNKTFKRIYQCLVHLEKIDKQTPQTEPIALVDGFKGPISTRKLRRELIPSKTRQQ